MNFEDLVDIVARLRGPGGCPWDREQTRETLRPFLVEEFYELIDAIEDRDEKGIKEELGDLLLQIVLQSQLAYEEGIFSIHDVVKDVAEKMISRHPHVFGDKDLKNSDDVKIMWEERKQKEGKTHTSAIGGVPRALPALLRAQKMQHKATKAGFDWERIEDVFEKLEEEKEEFREALKHEKKTAIEEELGDMFFVLVRIANFVNVNPEDALRKTIKKFSRRFDHIEKEAVKKGRNLSEMTLGEMDALWNEAKKK